MAAIRREMRRQLLGGALACRRVEQSDSASVASLTTCASVMFSAMNKIRRRMSGAG